MVEIAYLPHTLQGKSSLAAVGGRWRGGFRAVTPPTAVPTVAPAVDAVTVIAVDDAMVLE